MLNTFMQYCQAQTHASKMKMEYLRRREEREEKEHRAKLEAEQLRLERDRYELEQLKATNMSKLKAERAFVRLAPTFASIRYLRFILTGSGFEERH